MKKKLLFLLALMTLGGYSLVKADVITDPSQLSNTKVYTINTARGYLNLDTEESFLTSSLVTDKDPESPTYNQFVVENEIASPDEDARQFGILLIDGKYYLYSPKLKMFAMLHNQTLEFHPSAGTGLAFTKDGQEGAPLRLKVFGWGDAGDQAYYINNNGNIVLNKYTTVDPGNSLMVEEVEGATLDFDEAMEVFNADNEWFDSHHVYYISTDPTRMGQWGIDTDGLSVTGTREDADFSNPACADDDRKWAFYKDGSKTYLFNVGMKMFLSKNTKPMSIGGSNMEVGQLTTSKDEFASVKFVLSNNDNYPFTFYIEDNGRWFNGQGKGCMTVNTWRSNFDEGNRQMITEVEGEDAYEDMLEFFETPSWDITYRLMFEGQEVATVVRNMTKGFEAKLPDDMIFSSCSYEYSTDIITSNEDVEVEVIWEGPFEFSESYDEAIWYNLLFDRENEGRDGRWYAYWEEGTEPYYPKKNADDALRSAPQCQWAFVGSPYKFVIYNKAGGPDMTLANKGFDNGGNTAGATVLRPGEHYWIAKDYDPALDEFSIGVDVNGTFCRINQVGGASASSYFGLWTGFDVGSMLMTEDVPEVEVTDVFYDVYYEGEMVASAKLIGQQVDENIGDIPSSLIRDFVDLDFDLNVKVEPDLHVPVTATWVGPFELAKDFDSAKWFDLSVRGNWYVNCDSLDSDGALLTVEANPIGLGEDSYQWAFVGDPWHVKMYNKAKGRDVVYAWTAAESKNIPVFVPASTENYWQIRQLTLTDDIYANSFMLTIPENGWQLNQNGGVGGPLKIWSSTTQADAGSAFTVFDVPDDYSQFVVENIAPTMESETKWLYWNDAARQTIGYKPEYKESCTLEQYKGMMEAINKLKDDINNYELPPTGYYRMKNKYYSDFLGMSTDLVTSTDESADATTVVKFTKVGDRQYTIMAQDEYLQPLVRSTSMETNPDEAAVFTLFIIDPGYGAFTATEKPEDETDTDAMNAYNYSFMHRRQERDMVGWVNDSPASNWQLFDAKSMELTLGTEGVTTLYVPFAVQPVAGVTPFYGTVESDHVQMNPLEGNIPAHTGVVILAEPGTYTLPILAADGEAIEDNDLLGVLIQEKPSFAMTLEGSGEDVNFVKFEGEAIGPNKAYLKLDDLSIDSFPVVFGEYTGIRSMDNGQQSPDNAEIFNIAGQRVEKANKGVYIIDGKKMIVK